MAGRCSHCGTSADVCCLVIHDNYVVPQLRGESRRNLVQASYSCVKNYDNICGLHSHVSSIVPVSKCVR